METKIEKINSVLVDWNPIGVPDNIAIDEYKGYIPSILQSIGNRQQLFNCLEDILINKMGVGYDPTNKLHSNDLNQVCDKILQIIK